MINLDDELAETYLSKSREHLAAIESGLLAMEKGGAEIDDALVNRIVRALHSVGGGTDFFELPQIGELARQMETALLLMRSQRTAPLPERIGVLLSATDKLNDLVQNPATSNPKDISEIMTALAELPAGHSDPKTSGPSPQQTNQGGKHLRILLVEDDFSCRLLLQTFLARYGECHIAVNGREAVEAFRSAFVRGSGYDLICMDIMMPVMDGQEAVRQIRDFEEAHGIFSTSGARIIMTTAVDDIREVINSFRDLCDAYLVKPIDLSELVRQMRCCQLV